ncbi:MAG: hypothetical protein PCFJNLEI_02745 [Verrucomicrobiae bacterium]|nr:hypothetical protein [Verrucomicrobiae bacterium]
MKPKKPNSAGKPVVWGLLVVVLIIVVLWFPVLRPAYQRYKAGQDTAALVEALKMYAQIEGELPGGDLTTICRLLRGESVAGQNARKLDYVESYVVNDRGEFLDPWGTPYQIILQPQMRVYSCGPNKTDEHGQGDDLAAGAAR